MADLKKYIK